MTGNEIPAFLEACRQALGADRVRPAEEEKGAVALPRAVAGVVEPGTREEVQAVVLLANRHRIHLYPISTGNNWGFGSARPVKGGACLLDLSRMRRIREINLTFGFAVVEPGVTQGDLAEALRARNAPWTLDVTGAGPDTSLVGNALERGIAYHSQRTQTTRALELVTGDGTLLATGFQDPRVALLNNLYAHGVGPDPTGLFFQSRFGVVTAMTIDLLPSAGVHASVGLNVAAADLSRLIDALRELRRNGVLEGVPHIANRARFYSTLVPLLIKRSRKPLTRAQADDMLRKVFPEEWTLLASLRGPGALVRAKGRLVRRALSPLGRVWILTPFMRFLQRAVGWALPAMGAVMAATRSIQGLPLGVPSADPLQFLDFDLSPGSPPTDPDSHPRGFVYLVPLMPADGASVGRFFETLPALAEAAGQDPAVTLNALDGRVLEAVVSLTFDKMDPGGVQRTVKVGEEWLERLRGIGAHPYRVHIDHMAQTGPAEGPWASLHQRLASVLDPNRVLSRGRYEPGAPA